MCHVNAMAYIKLIKRAALYCFTCDWAVVIIPRDPSQFNTFALVLRKLQDLRCIRNIWKPSKLHWLWTNHSQNLFWKKKMCLRELVFNEITPSVRESVPSCITAWYCGCFFLCKIAPNSDCQTQHGMYVQALLWVPDILIHLWTCQTLMWHQRALIFRPRAEILFTCWLT